MISIIIPIYNASAYLKECLTSIQQQNYKEFEAICVDDGSKDESASIVNEFVKIDTRFKLFQQPNSGVSAARNLGLSKATAEYVCFIDADDVVDKDFLLCLYNLSKDSSFSVCSYARDIKQLGQIGTVLAEYSARDFVLNIIHETIEHPNIWMMLFKNSIIQTHHLDFTIGCVRNEDAEFFLKYLMYEERVKFSDYKGYYYRPNESSEMHVTTMRSLTCLEASMRIGKMLCANGFTDNENIDLHPNLQSMLYHLGRERNREIYDYIHKEYNVPSIMKEMLSYKARRRRVISIIYLALGKDMFYKVLSSKLAAWMPL